MDNDRIYNQNAERLRSPERIALLEPDNVTAAVITGNIKSILDIGTGSGIFAEKFSRKGIHVVGIDINPEMIDAAKEYLPQTLFETGEAEDLPFPNDSFDLAFMGLVFHEVNDYKKALSETYRVVKIGTAILEWKYLVEDFGPPLEHRLKSEFIVSLAKEIGFSKTEVINLNNLVLYKLGK